MRLLVIERDAVVRRSLIQCFRGEGYLVDDQSTGNEGLWAAREGNYDVILLEMMLPDVGGLEILRTLRAADNPVHILAISTRNDLEDRLEALNSGADDYLARPFDFSEAVARVRVLLRRGYFKKSPTMRTGDLEVDPRHRSVCRAGKTIRLTALEYRLLEYLSYRAGEVVSRSDIWDHVFEDGSGGMTNAVEVYISYLRKKLNAFGGPDLIQTRRGHGYVLDIPSN